MWADNEHDAINECLHDSGEFKCYMFFHTHTRPPKEWYKCQKNGKMQWKKGDVLYKPAQSEFNTKIFLQGVLFDIISFQGIIFYLHEMICRKKHQVNVFKD